MNAAAVATGVIPKRDATAPLGILNFGECRAPGRITLLTQTRPNELVMFFVPFFPFVSGKRAMKDGSEAHTFRGSVLRGEPSRRSVANLDHPQISREDGRDGFAHQRRTSFAKSLQAQVLERGRHSAPPTRTGAEGVETPVTRLEVGGGIAAR